MTPAVNMLKKAKVAHRVLQYEHDKSVAAFGEEAVEALGLPAASVFKTLIAQLDGKDLVCAVIPVPQRLDLKMLAHQFKAKKAEMADPEQAQKATGYIVGGISPLGQKRRLKMAIDVSAQLLPVMYVSGGRRGVDIELAPADLARLTQAVFAPVAR